MRWPAWTNLLAAPRYFPYVERTARVRRFRHSVLNTAFVMSRSAPHISQDHYWPPSNAGGGQFGGLRQVDRLDRHLAAELRIIGEVHDPHAARRYYSDDFVPPDPRKHNSEIIPSEFDVLGLAAFSGAAAPPTQRETQAPNAIPGATEPHDFDRFVWPIPARVDNRRHGGSSTDPPRTTRFFPVDGPFGIVALGRSDSNPHHTSPPPIPKRYPVTSWRPNAFARLRPTSCAAPPLFPQCHAISSSGP